MRIVVLVALAAVCVLLPVAGPNRHWVAFLLLALASVSVVLPFVVCSSMATSEMLGRRDYFVVEALGLVGLGCVAALMGVDGWIVPLAVAALMVPLVASHVDALFSHEATAAAQLDEFARSTSAVFFELDADTGDFLSLGGRVVEVLGYEASEAPPDLPHALVAEDRVKFWSALARAEVPDFVVECRAWHRDERIVWLRLHIRAVDSRGRRVLRGTAFDVTRLVAAHDEMRRRAEIDDLTGLANRAGLIRDLQSRLGSDRVFSLHVLGLDRFREIYGTLGYRAGDEFLEAMAGRIAANTPQGAFVARIGGDEFAIVAALGGADGAMTLSRELVAACNTGVDVGGLEIAEGASCGVAVAPTHASTAEDLLRRSELALHVARRNGSDVHLFDFTADERSVGRLKLSAEAGSALEGGQMRLWFQPKVDLVSGAVVGAEALLRWHHPDRGVLLPADFLDFVELSRSREVLCRLVLDQGVGFVRDAALAGCDMQVAVNMSMRDLVQPGFTSSVIARLAESGVRPDQLVVEVTERDITDGRSGFDRAANVIQSAGVELSIDDFGTGHSSLLRLHQLPVTELKIDRSFVSGLGSDPEAEIIVRSIVELGESLGHRVVAEGIETEQEREILLELGCRIGQGFLYSAAVPADEFLRLASVGFGTSADSMAWAEHPGR